MNLVSFLNVTRIQEVMSPEAANDLLANGWRLIFVGERTRSSTDSSNRPYVHVSPVYVFGWSSSLQGEQQTIPTQREAKAKA